MLTVDYTDDVCGGVITQIRLLQRNWGTEILTPKIHEAFAASPQVVETVSSVLPLQQLWSRVCPTSPSCFARHSCVRSFLKPDHMVYHQKTPGCIREGITIEPEELTRRMNTHLFDQQWARDNRLISLGENTYQSVNTLAVPSPCLSWLTRHDVFSSSDDPAVNDRPTIPSVDVLSKRKRESYLHADISYDAGLLAISNTSQILWSNAVRKQYWNQAEHIGEFLYIYAFLLCKKQ